MGEWLPVEGRAGEPPENHMLLPRACRITLVLPSGRGMRYSIAVAVRMRAYVFVRRHTTCGCNGSDVS